MKQLKKIERTHKLYRRIAHALDGTSATVERNHYDIALSKICRAGGHRSIHVEYIGGAWQLYRRWSECPLGFDYGENIPGESVESEAKVVILVKRWLIQGLR